MKKKRICYLAGPMRSKPNFNYPAFDAAALKLRELGWQVYNPAEMDRVLDGHDYTGYTIEEQKELGEENSARYAQRDLNILINELHKKDGDAVILLEGWEDSIGATRRLGRFHWGNRREGSWSPGWSEDTYLRRSTQRRDGRTWRSWTRC